MTQKEKFFTICKYVAINALRNQEVVIKQFEYIKQQYDYKKDLEEVRVLTNILEKLINERNSKIQANITKIDNMRCDEGDKWLESKLLKGINIPFKKIREKITEYPDMDYYDIYRNYFWQNK